MAAIGTLPVLLGTGIHASRPSASAVGKGGLYACSTHSLIYQTDGSSWTTWATLTGTGLTDPMTTRGDSIYRNASNVTDRLAIPAAGQVIGRSGSDLGAVYPPGYEIDYVTRTSDLSVTATSEATAATVIASTSLSYDGTPVIVTCYAAYVAAGLSGTIVHDLYVDSTIIGRIAQHTNASASVQFVVPMMTATTYTPSAGTRTFTWKAWRGTADGVIKAASGGTGAYQAAYIRIVKK